MKCYKMLSQISRPLSYSGFRMLALLSVLAMSVTACMKPSARSADPNGTDPAKIAGQGSATFFTSKIEGSAVVSKNMQGFSIPTEKLFQFSTCVKDKRTDEVIKGHKFSIHGAPGAVVVAMQGRTDGTGCLTWSEKVAYNGLADGKYISIKRILVADGMHTGARELEICLNPWEATDVVRDCGRFPVPASQLVKPEDNAAALKGELAGSRSARHLWINDLRLSATHNPGGADTGMVDFSVSMGPKVLRYNVKGEEEPLALADGIFAMQFWIIAKTGDKTNKCSVIAKSRPGDEMKMIGGRLQDEMKMTVKYMSSYGQLELVGVVQPKDNAIGLTPYSGLWLLGDHSALLGMKFGFERTDSYKGTPGTFDAHKYVQNCTDVVGGQTLSPLPSAPVAVRPTTAAAAPGATATVDGKVIVAPDLMTNDCVDAPDIPRLFPEDSFAKDFKGGTDLLSCVNKNLPSGITRLEQFEFAPAVVRPEPIIDPRSTETTTERTIKYRVLTLVTNPLAQGAPLRDIEFLVDKSDGSVDEVRTNNRGELIFTDKIHHFYFQQERFMLKVIRIRHASGFSKRMAIVFNPWDNNGFTFARDIRDGMTKQTIAQVNLIPRPESELLVTQFQWGTQGFRYEVDDFLNLKMFKQFNLTLTPRVLRYSSLTEGRMKNEPLRDGIFLMKVAIQKDYKPIDGDALEFVTATRKLVRVASGQIVTPVEMAFRDFRILKLRANLMIEITTIDEAKLSPGQRKTLIFDGPLDSLIEKNSGLPSRTFIGPVVAYSNGFSSSMRPADDLSESFCKTIDCDELKKKDKIPPSELAEEAKFFGSIRHLADKSVGDMITRQALLEKNYQSHMTATAKLSYLLKDGNFEYAAVENEQQILKQDAALPKNNTVLTNGNAFADLIKRMSNIDGNTSFSTSAMAPFSQHYRKLVKNKPVDVAGFKDILFGVKPLTQEVAARLCVVFIEDLILQRNDKQEESLSFMQRAAARSTRTMLNDECMRSLFRPEGVLSIERKIRIFELADSERRGGNLMSLGVGAGSAYSMSKSQSFTYGWSPTSTVSGILKVAGLGVAEKFLDVLGVNVNISRSDSKSTSQDTSVDTKQSISVELRGMRLTLGQYERCTTIKLSQSFIEDQFHYLVRAVPQNLSLLERLNRMRRGLFLCEGAVSKKPLQVEERYYQFSQMIGEEVMNDPTALENHPYLIMTLRSRADFARMVRMIEARPQSLSDLPNHVNIGELPMQRLMSVFKTAIPSFPGIFTLEPDSIVQAPVLHRMEPAK